MANTLKFGNGEWYGKEGTILAYNDENYNYKPLPFNFERGSSATVVNKDGLIETVGSDMPRIDYKDDSKGALLLEPSRTNKNLFSTDFSRFTAVEATLDKSFTAPDGTLNATKLTDNSVSSTHRIMKTCTTSSSGSATYSVFLKKGTMTNAVLNLFSGNTIGTATVDLDSGTITLNSGTSADIEDYGDDWYRCSVTGTLGSTSTTIYVYMGDSKSPYVGTNQDLYVWGAQLEEGSYATSYIPTQGSAATRLADVCSQTVPDGVIGQTEGTLFLDFKVLSEGEINANIFNTNKNTTNAIAVIRTKSTKELQVQTFFSSVNVNYVSTNPYNVGDKIKLAFKYKSGDVKLYINGILENSATTTFTISSSLDEINLADNVTYFARKEALHFNELKLFKEALTDAELIALTS